MNIQGYGQFGISRKGSEDTADEHCTIFYEKEKVTHPILLPKMIKLYNFALLRKLKMLHIPNIFFCQMKVELLEGGTFWLSESPSVPGSMSWGSEVPCIATWAISFSNLIFTLHNLRVLFLNRCTKSQDS